MTKKLIKKIGIITFFILTLINIPTIGFAADGDLDVNGFDIIPKLEENDINDINQKITTIGQSGGNVWKNYNAAASGMTTAKQIASGIMTRDTIMDYLVFVVKFLSQLGLLVGTGFIIYAGYKYMVAVFNGLKTPSSTVINAIIGVIIVIFSYAIMRILTSLIGLS